MHSCTTLRVVLAFEEFRNLDEASRFRLLSAIVKVLDSAIGRVLRTKALMDEILVLSAKLVPGEGLISITRNSILLSAAKALRRSVHCLNRSIHIGVFGRESILTGRFPSLAGEYRWVEVQHWLLLKDSNLMALFLSASVGDGLGFIYTLLAPSLAQ